MKTLKMQLFAAVLLSVFAQGQQGIIVSGSELASASVPNLIKFSGVLRDGTGMIITNPSGVTFLIYKDEQGGVPVWMETQSVQPDKSGHYTVQLGAVSKNGLPRDVFMTGEARWLGVQIEGQAEQPRVMLVSVPYALKAGDAATLGGLPASAFVLAAPSSGNPVASSAPSNSGTSTTSPPPTSSNVTTSGGTVNTIPLFTTATNIQNSILSQTGTTGINVRGTLNLPAKGTATSSAGFNSQPQDFVASVFNGTAAVPQTFQWQAEPVNNDKSRATGTLNLLFGSGTTKPAETGFNIASNGLITFASGQTFPGTGSGTVTSVGLSAPATDFSVSGSPVTSSGTLNLAWTTAPTSANTPNAIVKRDASGNINTGFVAATSLSVTGPITAGTASASILNASSKLGIGTAAPAVPLDVFSSTAGIHAPMARFGSSGTIDANSISVYNGTGTTEMFEVGGPSSFMPGTATGDGGVRVLPGKNLFLGDSGEARLELTPGGTAIIASAAPTVIGNPGCGAGGFGGIGFGAASMADCLHYSLLGDGLNTYLNRPANGAMVFREANTTEMTIAPGGNVGIGVAAPGYPLHVNGTMRSETGLSLGGNATLSVDAPGIAGGQLLVANGNVGIGTNAPQFPLHVQGTIRSETGLQLGGNAVLSVDAPGVPNGRLLVNNSGVSIGLDTPMNSNPHLSFGASFPGSFCDDITCGGPNLTPGAGFFVPDKNIAITHVSVAWGAVIDPSCAPVQVLGYVGNVPNVTEVFSLSLPVGDTTGGHVLPQTADFPFAIPVSVSAGSQVIVTIHGTSCNAGASAGGIGFANVQYVMQ